MRVYFSGMIGYNERLMNVPNKAILFMLLIFAALLCSGQTPLKIKVIADYADIRSNPSVDAQVLEVALKGEIFAVMEKSGAWYKIKLSVDESGQVSSGYLHESMVAPAEMVEGQEKTAEPPKKPEPVSPTLPVPTPPLRNFFSGTFLKFGFGERRWIVSLGNDFGIKRNFALGFELQPYYKDYSEENLTVLEMNIFANAKVGYRYSFLSLFGGGGIGPNLYYTNAEIEGESESHLDTRLAYHLLAGVAFNIRSVALIFEYQAIKISDPLVDPDPWTHFFIFGLRF